MPLMKVYLRLLPSVVHVTDEGEHWYNAIKLIHNQDIKKTKNKNQNKNQNKNKTTEIIYNLIKHDYFSVDRLRKHLSILPESKIATLGYVLILSHYINVHL
jgi:hypothetical protein